MLQLRLMLLTALLWVLASPAMAAHSQPWQHSEKGHYSFGGWAGGELDIQFSVPADSNADTPILMVIPGARRNADQYRDHWHELAMQHGFIVLAIGCDRQVCPTEYDYNLGGLLDARGNSRPSDQQFFLAPEQVFSDFVQAFGSNQKQFALYGHSAGGGFVHLYMLARPSAPVSQAVSANAAFFTLPEPDRPFPFGLKGTSLDATQVDSWLQRPLTIMLADQDLGPRTKPLSNSESANQQGLNVFARGLAFYAGVINRASARQIQPVWKLEIVQGVGHNSAHIAPHAVKYLFPRLTGDKA